MGKLVERFQNGSGKTAIISGIIWCTVFIPGLVTILVATKQLNEGEITEEKWSGMQRAGWTLIVISILLSPFIIVSFAFLVVWLLTYLKLIN